MNTLAIVFVALIVAVSTAEADVKVIKMKSLERIKRAATQLTPLRTLTVEKKDFSEDELQFVITAIDADKDGMLNAKELKTLLRIGGNTIEDLDTYTATLLMLFDGDKNGKLDINEMGALALIAGM